MIEEILLSIIISMTGVWLLTIIIPILYKRHTYNRPYKPTVIESPQPKVVKQVNVKLNLPPKKLEFPGIEFDDFADFNFPEEDKTENDDVCIFSGKTNCNCQFCKS